MKKILLSLLALGASFSAFAITPVGSVSGPGAEAIWNDLDKGGVRTQSGVNVGIGGINVGFGVMTKDVGRLHCEQRMGRRGIRYRCDLRAPDQASYPGWNAERDGNDAEIFFAISDRGEWGPTRNAGPLFCESRFQDHFRPGPWGGNNRWQGPVRRWGGRGNMPNWARCWFN